MVFNEELLRESGFSNKAIKYIIENKNYGKKENATIEGRHTGTCGDTIIIYLTIKNRVIKDSSFIYTGCAGSAAAGSAIVQLIKGKTIEEAGRLTLKNIIDFYKEGEKGFPEFKYECGDIAVSALKDALKNYNKKIGKSSLVESENHKGQRIAFASEENKGTESMLAYHFGRCLYYVFVEVEDEKTKSTETKENPFFSKHEPGIVPQFIADEKADVIIARGMGPNAIEWFEKLGVEAITTNPKKIKDILKDYLRGNLYGAESCKNEGG